MERDRDEINIYSFIYYESDIDNPLVHFNNVEGHNMGIGEMK